MLLSEVNFDWQISHAYFCFVSAFCFTCTKRWNKPKTNCFGFVLGLFWICFGIILRCFVSVVRAALVKSNHKAIVAYAHQNCGAPAKTRVKRTYRRITPTHHALFLQHVSTLDISVDMHSDTQTMVDNFYRTAWELLDRFYPERTITVSSRDPDDRTIVAAGKSCVISSTQVSI